MYVLYYIISRETCREHKFSFWASGKAMDSIYRSYYNYTPVQMTGVFFMKKFSAILLSIIMCITFFGCSADKTELKDSQITAVQSTIKAETTSDTKNSTSVIKADDTTQSRGTSENESAKNKQSTESSIKTKNASNSKTTKASAKNTEKTSTSKNPTKNKSSTAQSTTKKKTTTTKKQTTTSSTITCTVTVECKSILKNMDKLADGHAPYVPSDGYFINGCTVTLANGSSAYDAVQLACNKQGVHMTTVNSGYGKYVKGFNNIDEKDCGSQSGWLYFVNGSSPSKSCSKYKLSNGDNVVFSYTCK